MCKSYNLVTAYICYNLRLRHYHMSAPLLLTPAFSFWLSHQDKIRSYELNFFRSFIVGIKWILWPFIVGMKLISIFYHWDKIDPINLIPLNLLSSAPPIFLCGYALLDEGVESSAYDPIHMGMVDTWFTGGPHEVEDRDGRWKGPSHYFFLIKSTIGGFFTLEC